MSGGRRKRQYRLLPRAPRAPRAAERGGARAPDGSALEAAALAVHKRPRRVLIAEAAYFRAAARGFHGGDPVEDWLAAEADIDARLARDLGERARG